MTRSRNLAQCGLPLLLALMATEACGPAPPTPGPIIDMHLHPTPWTRYDGMEDASDFTAAWQVVADTMEQLNIVLALGSGPMDVMEHWRALAPDRIVAGVLFPCDGPLAPNGGRQCFEDGDSMPDLVWLRTEIEEGRVGFLGEITTQYVGLPPTAPMMEPYYALAEELDVPVAIHMGNGPPGSPYPNGPCGPDPCARRYKTAYSNPIYLEEVLVRHPDLRVWVMHAGWPRLEEMIQVLYMHPRVHAGIAALSSMATLPAFHDYLCALVKNGFGQRILYGTDTNAAGTRATIDAIRSAPCMDEELERDILYDNAATFLRLSGG